MILDFPEVGQYKIRVICLRAKNLRSESTYTEYGDTSDNPCQQ